MVTNSFETVTDGVRQTLRLQDLPDLQRYVGQMLARSYISRSLRIGGRRMNDTVNHPNHYTKGGIECIQAIKASMTADGFADYCKGNVLKYIWRWRDKVGVEDLRKAKVYLDWLIETAESEENNNDKD